MNRIGYGLLCAVATGLLSCLPLTAAADEDAGNGALAQLFDQALEAEGQEYVSVRDHLVSDPDAGEFLEHMTLSTNLQSRVIARAMLSWAEEREVNEDRYTKVMGILKLNASRILPMLDSVQSAAYVVDWDKSALRHSKPDSVIHCDDAVPFLLELALKGQNSVMAGESYYEEYAGCYAAALVGAYKGADVFSVLVELLETSDDDKLRACAVTGLRQLKTPEVMKPLLSALSDKSGFVRRSASLALRDITTVNYGEDVQKYEAWWEENKATWFKALNSEASSDSEESPEMVEKSPSIGYKALEKLFNEALEANGAEYASIRGEILSDSNGREFLDKKILDILMDNEGKDYYRNTRIRILAKSMTYWTFGAEQYKRNYEYIYSILNGIPANSKEILNYIIDEALKEGGYPEIHEASFVDRVFRQSETYFLLELIMKGPDISTRDDEEKQKWARCFAAGVVGANKGEDIVFVLADLLENSASYELRTMAAVGLRRTKSLDAVEPLIAALSDKEESVRKAASQGLKEITGMDFGADAQQYQTWWSANKDRLAENAPE